MANSSIPIYNATDQVWKFGAKDIDISNTDDVFIEGVLYDLSNEERAKVQMPVGNDFPLLKIQFALENETKAGKANHYLIIDNRGVSEIMTGSDVVDGKVKAVVRLNSEGGLFVEDKNGNYVFMQIEKFVIEPGTDPLDPRNDSASPGTMRVVGKNIYWPNKCR